MRKKVSLTKVGAIISLIGSSLLILLLVGSMIQSLIPERETQPVEESKPGFTIKIELEEREDVNPLIVPIINGSYIVSCGLSIAGSIILLQKEKSNKALVSSCIGSLLLLLVVLYVSRNCCGIVLIIFPFTCSIGNILSIIGWRRENFEEIS